MSNKPFHYQTPFPPEKDDTEYYLLTSEHVSVSEFEGQEILKVAPEALALLARQVFRGASFVLHPAHQQQVADILRDPEASEGGKYVALQFLRNSDIVAKGVLSACQDTGAAIIASKRGQRAWTGGGDEAALARGVYNTYIEDNLRYSRNASLDMYKGVNTGTNLPAQIDLYAVDGDEYKFPCIAKGGGSIDKTYLYQETRALLIPGKLKNYLVEKIRTLGTVACPPYHITLVIGETSVETNLETMKLASAKYYDELPTEENEHGQVFRNVELEKKLLIEAQNLGLGAQFGGKYFVHDIRVIRLPRHGVSCPVGMGASYSAGRNIKAKINHRGIWVGKLEHNPGKYIPEGLRKAGKGEAVRIDLGRPMKKIPAQLSQCPISTRLSLNGTIIIDRDIACARLKERMDNGEGLPQHIKDHPICYVDPAKAPEDYASGSLGPTIAGRMDSYVDQLQTQGGSMITLAKGSHSQQVTGACRRHDGFYLGSIDDPATVLAQGSIKSLGYVKYPELGMEAAQKVEVENFPAFVLVDGKGSDFFQQTQLTQYTRCVK